MIHIVTKGGLGNQMFQYAFAIKLQQIHQQEKIRINSFLHAFTSDKRPNSMHHFQLSGSSHLCNRVQACCSFLSCVKSVIRVIGCKALFRCIKFRNKVLRENAEALQKNGLYLMTYIYGMPDIKKTDGNKYVYGYFQTPDVVKGIEDILRREFTIKTKPSKENQEKLDEIASCNAVCVHVRRGDYSLFPQLQICNKEYYSEAMKQASNILQNPVFFVFSNTHEDLEWIRENYQFEGDVRYVDLNNPDYEELRLMVACKHFIISNSTYSWWAAVLSSSAGCEKNVWSPKAWLKDANVKMYFDSWNLI